MQKRGKVGGGYAIDQQQHFTEEHKNNVIQLIENIWLKRLYPRFAIVHVAVSLFDH